MEKTTDQTAKKSEPQADFFAVSEIDIRLTYPFLKQDEPFKFFFKIQMAKADKLARANFATLTPEEKDEKRAEYNLELAASLMTRLPENVPHLLADTNNLEESKDVFKKFFAPGNPLKEQMLEDALNLYFARVQPVEFFRGY